MKYMDSKLVHSRSKRPVLLSREDLFLNYIIASSLLFLAYINVYILEMISRFNNKIWHIRKLMNQLP